MHRHKHGRGHGHRNHGGPGAPWWDKISQLAGIARGFDDWGKSGPGNFGGFGGPGDSGHGRGGRRGRMFGSGELRLVLLKLIADEARHGYELIKSLEELTGGTYSPSPGTIYPTLSLLEDEGVIEACEGEGARKAFAATEQGKAELAEKSAEVEAILARLAGFAEREERGHKPELLRAMANLGSVLRHRYRGGSFDRATLEEIVDIIDDAAKRIERL